MAVPHPAPTIPVPPSVNNNSEVVVSANASRNVEEGPSVNDLLEPAEAPLSSTDNVPFYDYENDMDIDIASTSAPAITTSTELHFPGTDDRLDTEPYTQPPPSQLNVAENGSSSSVPAISSTQPPPSLLVRASFFMRTKKTAVLSLWYGQAGDIDEGVDYLGQYVEELQRVPDLTCTFLHIFPRSSHR